MVSVLPDNMAPYVIWDRRHSGSAATTIKRRTFCRSRSISCYALRLEQVSMPLVGEKDQVQLKQRRKEQDERVGKFQR